MRRAILARGSVVARTALCKNQCGALVCDGGTAVVLEARETHTQGTTAKNAHDTGTPSHSRDHG